jgi:hypothetical protein
VPTEYVPVRREQARLKFAGLLDALALDEPGVVAS